VTFDARSLADCLTCWREAELNEFLKILYPCLVNQLPGSSDLDCGTPPSGCPPGGTAAGCSATIAKAGIGLFLAEDQVLATCLDEMRRGRITGPCPDAAAQAQITAAEQRKERLLQRCTDMPPWWDVCPEDSTQLCDQRIGSVADIASCVDSAAGAIAAEVICEQYPNAARDGITCPGREPFCGDGQVNRPSEQCDPPGSSCPGGGFCKSDCTCPSCGDGVVNQPSEQCDPPGSATCGGGRTCNPDCTCPSACLFPTVVPAAGGTLTATTAGPSTLQGSCGYFGTPEEVFQWTPAVSGTAGVDFCSPGLFFLGAVYVRSGDCESGPELVCQNNCDATFPVTAGQTYFIIADGSVIEGNLAVTVSPPACGSPVVIPPSGGTVTGTTAGASTLTGSCGFFTSFAPEQVFEWTPAMSGKAMIETCGGSTNFDTVLYMRSGDCENGAELACGSTGCSPGSVITPTVTAGQTYFIIVDGFSREQGNFTLTVTPLFCGDGTVTPPEQCDPPGSVSCPDAQTCNADCTCPPPVCGNGVVAPPEQCDPPGSTCPDGQACRADCTCPPPICGNSIVTPPEQCDPPGSSCLGGATCQADCTCPCHSECIAGTALSSTCSSCAATVCRFDPFCCQVFWDRFCIDEAEHDCPGLNYCGH
jgi:hypothetical protein